MDKRQDPESTHSTLIIDSTAQQLLVYGVPGDRVQIFVKAPDGRSTGCVTTRILSVDLLPDPPRLST